MFHYCAFYKFPRAEALQNKRMHKRDEGETFQNLKAVERTETSKGEERMKKFKSLNLP